MNDINHTRWKLSLHRRISVFDNAFSASIIIVVFSVCSSA